MAYPTLIRAGDSVRWQVPAGQDLLGNPAASSAWAGVTYLRFNAASEALTVNGTARSDGGWDFYIAPATTVSMNAGWWYRQTTISNGTDKITINSGRLEVQPSLAYAGTAAAFDGRSQIQTDLEAVQAAIRAIIAGGAVKAYTIGTRQLAKCSLQELMQLEAKLKAELARERKAELIANGLGNPHNLFVRFS